MPDLTVEQLRAEIRVAEREMGVILKRLVSLTKWQELTVTTSIVSTRGHN